MFEFLADEENTRVITNVSAIFAIVGIVIPFILAVAQYRADRRRASRDDALATLEIWGKRESVEERIETVEILKAFNAHTLGFDEIMNDASKAGRVISFLDTNEYVALYTLVDGTNSVRVEITRKMQRGALLRYWETSSAFIRSLRQHADNPKLYREFERLAKVFH